MVDEKSSGRHRDVLMESQFKSVKDSLREWRDTQTTQRAIFGLSGTHIPARVDVVDDLALRPTGTAIKIN
jgi:hypothetical protein